jgi:hypothetical protein
MNVLYYARTALYHEGLSCTVRGLPCIMQGLPWTMRGLPCIMQALPCVMPGLPSTMQGLPCTMRGLPCAVRRLRRTLRTALFFARTTLYPVRADLYHTTTALPCTMPGLPCKYQNCLGQCQVCPECTMLGLRQAMLGVALYHVRNVPYYAKTASSLAIIALFQVMTALNQACNILVCSFMNSLYTLGCHGCAVVVKVLHVIAILNIQTKCGYIDR